MRAPAAVAAIVLAAGRATRMGSQKMLLELEGRSLVQRVADAALRSRAAKTVVVVGHEAGPVTDQLAGRPVTVVVNPDYAAGMSTSLQAGIRAAGACDAAIILLGDQPYVTARLLDELIEAFVETGKAVVRPLVGARPANPVLLSATLFPEIFAQQGDVGGREIIARHADEVGLVAMDDLTLVVDIDSPEDYEKAKVSS
jgi:molybdenum cofactor cytidylyltransferase